MFAHPRCCSRNPIFKFLIAMSIADSLYTGILFGLRLFEIVSTPTKLFVQSSSYFYLLLNVVASDYFTSCLAIFNILMECFIKVHRILIVSRKDLVFYNKAGLSFRMIGPGIILASLSIYIPVLFMKQIEQVSLNRSDSNTTTMTHEYKLVVTKFGRSIFSAVYTNIITFVRISLVTFVLFVLNIAALVKMKAYLSQKRVLKGYRPVSSIQRPMPNNPKDKLIGTNVTTLLASISFLFILANLPYSIYFLLKQTFNIRLFDLFIISHLSVNLLIILKIFFYYFLSKPFKLTLNRYVRTLIRIFKK